MIAITEKQIEKEIQDLYRLKKRLQHEIDNISLFNMGYTLTTLKTYLAQTNAVINCYECILTDKLFYKDYMCNFVLNEM